MSESKSTEERRREIINAARHLFFTKGYEATSTTDIMKAVGIAKGTLYYHFSSKEEILDTLLEDIADHMVQRAMMVKENSDYSVVERMIGVIMAANIACYDDGDIIETLHLPQNAIFHQKSYALTIKKLSPIMLEIVMEGIEQGIFRTDYPESAVHMAMSYSVTAFEDDNIQNINLIYGFVYNLERLLGAEKGSLKGFLKLFQM